MSVLFDIDGHVGRVTINRPERMNAIDSATHKQLAQIWEDIENNPDIRCVVLTGSGEKAFSAGADMKEDTGKSGVEYWREIKSDFSGIALRRTLNKPVIARVNGLALGGGLEMVLGCDIVIASETARFALPEAKVGRVPLDGGMVLLQRLIPRNIAVGMMMTGKMVSAEDMKHYGLVNSVVPSSQLDEEVNLWVDDILAAAPLSLRAIKTLVRGTGELPIHEAFSLNTPELLDALNSEDAREGVEAFREKRTPVWKGR